MNQNFLLLLIIGFYSNFLIAQSVALQTISSAGGFYSNSSGSLSVTIAEPLPVTTVTNTAINLILTQGFQQPDIASSVFPLKLIEFKGTRIKDSITVSWKVLNEFAIKSYSLLKSTDGRNFTAAGIVDALNNGREENRYNFMDKGQQGTTFYKLLIKEKDGKQSDSWIIKINGKGDEIKVYPIPVKKDFFIELYLAEPVSRVVKLLNMAGTLLWTKTFTLAAGKQTISIDLTNQPAGSYLLNGIGTENIMIIKQ